MLKINKAWFGQIIFGLAEHGITRVLDALTTIYLIRVLASESFGQFAVFQSWVSIILLFLPFIETAIYREYGNWKAENKLSKMLAVFQIYNIFKIFITLLICLTISVGYEDFTNRFLLMLFAFALPLSQSIYAVFRDPLKFEMKQNWVTYLTAIQKLLILVGLYISQKYFNAEVAAIVLVSMCVYILMGAVWYIQSKKFVSHSSVSFKVAFSEVSHLMKGTTLWIHINGVITSVVSTLDLFMLNFHKLPLDELARYGIATKSANFFQMIPIALINVFGVYLGKVQSEKNYIKERNLMLKLSGLFLILALITLMFGAFVGKPLIQFIGKNKVQENDLINVLVYYKWQLAGYMMMAASFPLSTYLGARSNLRKMTYYLFIPWVCLSALTYYIAASVSPIWSAKANVVVYSLLYLFFILFYFDFKKEKHE